MRIIELDASGWKTPLDFMHSLYEGIEQGHPHGMSPDAFVDSMIWRGMGGVEPPYVVKVINLKAARPEVTEYVAMMASLLAEARQERLDSQGIDIEVSISVPPSSNQGDAPSQNSPEVRCAWCGKSQSEVKRMIVTAGASWLKPPPPKTSICNECVELCMEVLAIEDAGWRDTQIERLKEMAVPPEDDPETPLERL